MEIEKILAHAKKILLERGEHDPLIIVETVNNDYMLPVHRETWNTKDALKKAMGFFIRGQELAREEAEQPEDVTQLILINEVWFALPGSDETDEMRYRRASTRADRREGLMVLTASPQNGAIETQTPHVVEIIRYKQGGLDLAPFPLPSETVASSLFLPGFLEGMKHYRLTEKETTIFLRRFYRKESWS